ncbi:PREDICTED: histone deacetylase 10 [Mandrillus leucophaeus]|uniref:histone deacetylase 10 n=1 Tax=Mandrillus leucophaeus TaxID=9568 RepID=UPI0005F53179|nr:PREDICTED: histone deacetylase 10 [Mandrillus leucophaeus]
MQATPECFAHLTHLLQVLAGGRVCAMLEGGYHLESLAESVCMTVQTLLGDPAPPLSGLMVPCQSALESIQSARAAQAPYWKSLQLQDVTPVPTSPSTHSPEGRPPPLLPGGPMCKAAVPAPAPSSLLDRPCLCPAPSVRTTVALTVPDITLVLPPDVIQQEGSALREETEAWARWAGLAWGGWGRIYTCDAWRTGGRAGRDPPGCAPRLSAAHESRSGTLSWSSPLVGPEERGKAEFVRCTARARVSFFGFAMVL